MICPTCGHGDGADTQDHNGGASPGSHGGGGGGGCGLDRPTRRPLPDHDNHHNALLCPYCNPDGLVLASKVPDIRAQLAWALTQLRILVTHDDGAGCFVRETGVELAGFGAKMKEAEQALKTFKKFVHQHADAIAKDTFGL